MARARRGRLLTAVACLTILMTSASLVPGPRPCRETFERVRVGMTRDQVLATVGEPPGDYGRGESWWGAFGMKYLEYEGWLGADAQLIVRFDDGGRADDVLVLVPIHFPREPTPWDRVRQRLGL